MVSNQHGLNQLAGSRGFTADPACCSRRDVTFDTFDPGVRRILVRREFGMHRVACGTAELRRLHVLNGAISDLGSDKDVHQRYDTEKPSQTVKCGAAIEPSSRQSLPNLPLAQIDADRNQGQAEEENDGKNQENNDSNVRIRDMPTNLLRQDK